MSDLIEELESLRKEMRNCAKAHEERLMEAPTAEIQREHCGLFGAYDLAAKRLERIIQRHSDNRMYRQCLLDLLSDAKYEIKQAYPSLDDAGDDETYGFFKGEIAAWEAVKEDIEGFLEEIEDGQ